MDSGWAGQPDMYYRKVIQNDTDKVSLDADMIRLLIAIDEKKSLYQIAEELDMETASLKQTLVKLLKQGLIEPVEKNVPVLRQDFLVAVKISLSRAIGPMAEILIEDVAAEMQLRPSEIPVHQAAELIANLSKEIPDEESRMEFKKSMIKILNKKKT